MIRKRIIAFLIDCIIIVSPCIFFSVIYVFFNDFISKLKFKNVIYVLYLISMFFCYIGLLGKDVISKRSVGKRIVNIKILSLDGTKPNYFQLIIRNIFMLIWPIEALMLLLDQPRLGDRIAKTKIENTRGRFCCVDKLNGI